MEIRKLKTLDGWGAYAENGELMHASEKKTEVLAWLAAVTGEGKLTVIWDEPATDETGT